VNFFPLKFKIFLVLFGVPLVCLGIYVGLAVQTLKKDKLAYVYDLASVSTQILVQQIRSEYKMAVTLSQPALQEHIRTGSFGPLTQSLILNQERILFIAAHRLGHGLVEDQPKDLVERSSGELSRLRKSHPDYQSTLLSYSDSEENLIVLDESRWILLKTFTNGAQTWLYIVCLSTEPILASFQANPNTNNFWINNKNQINLASDEKYASAVKDFLTKEPSVSVNGQKAAESRALETRRWTSDLGPLLVSQLPTGIASSKVLTLVPEEQALKSLTILVRDSLLLGLLILCLAIILAIALSRLLTNPLAQLTLATKKISDGDFSFHLSPTTRDEIGHLTLAFNSMTQEISRLIIEASEKARMAKELAIAQAVQETLFPKREFHQNGVDICGYYEPASEVGGDWWYYNTSGDRIYLWLGDATGHGAPAALITSAARAVASVVENFNLEPTQILRFLNQAIYSTSKGKVQMTFVAACLDTKTGEFTYAIASHEPPYYLPHRESFTREDLFPLNTINSPRLGENPETIFLQDSLVLKPGDKILFYTDGLTDLASPSGDPLSERALLKFVVESQKLLPSARQLSLAISEQVISHRQASPLVDDLTYFVVEFARQELRS
jgi:sigma-B regulation protein RsbU (phosphoserine phosphatase)